jgi:AAA+ superfamily predicted ATPase
MPEDMNGKIIITNTVTSSDVEDLRERKVRMLITTTPEFSGRSFGTNVMEALLVSILKKDIDKITPKDYEDMLDKLGFEPRIVHLNDDVK